MHLIEELLLLMGEDITREGLQGTPERVVKAFKQMTGGMAQDPAQILSKQFSVSDASSMVVVTGIEFNSLCEHHMLPFSGIAHVGYIPKDKVVGLSKIPRLVQCFAQRLQIQERLTSEIAHTFNEYVPNGGVGVVIQAHHSCMSLRGIKSSGNMTTSCVLGAFHDEAETRQEFMSLINASIRQA